MPIATGKVLKQPDDLLTKENQRQTFFEFESDGFPTDRRSTPDSAINRAHEGLLERAHQIHRDCHELLFTVDINKSHPKEILCATLFARALERYQAALILLGTDLIASAKVVLRATIESVFTIRAVATDKDAWRDFVNDDLFQR